METSLRSRACSVPSKRPSLRRALPDTKYSTPPWACCHCGCCCCTCHACLHQQILVNKLTHRRICEFCTMMTYAYHFQRDLYHWHLDVFPQVPELAVPYLRFAVHYPHAPHKSPYAVVGGCCSTYNLSECADICRHMDCWTRRHLLTHLGEGGLMGFPTWYLRLDNATLAAMVDAHDRLVAAHLRTFDAPAMAFKVQECRRYIVSSMRCFEKKCDREAVVLEDGAELEQWKGHRKQAHGAEHKAGKGKKARGVAYKKSKK